MLFCNMGGLERPHQDCSAFLMQGKGVVNLQTRNGETAFSLESSMTISSVNGHC